MDQDKIAKELLDQLEEADNVHQQRMKAIDIKYRITQVSLVLLIVGVILSPFISFLFKGK